MEAKRADLILLIIFPLIATFVTIALQTGLLESVLMYFGIPATYLVLRNPGIFKKSFAFALLLSAPLSIFVDTLAAINGAWVIPNSIFPLRLFGVATVEVYLFGLLWVLCVILCYEHFLDEGRPKDRLPGKIKYLCWISAVLSIYAVAGFSFDDGLLHITFFYGLVGLVLVIIPLIIFLLIYPFFWRRFALVGIYCFYLLFLFEIAALVTGQWIFPGSDFVGFVALFGLRIPIEEVVIWMLLSSPSLLAYYEFFGDNQSIG